MAGGLKLSLLAKFLRIGMNKQECALFQRYLGLILRQHITGAACFTETQGIVLQGIVQIAGMDTCRIPCDRKKRKLVSFVSLDSRASWSTQQPTDRRAINNEERYCIDCEQQQHI